MLFFDRYLISKIGKNDEINERYNTNVLAVAKDYEEETSMEKLREYYENLHKELRFLRSLKSQIKKQTISEAEFLKGICFFFEVNYDKAPKKDREDVSKKIKEIYKYANEVVENYPDFAAGIKDEFINERDYDLELLENQYGYKIESTGKKLYEKYREFLDMRSEVNENSEFYDELFAKENNKEM